MKSKPRDEARESGIHCQSYINIAVTLRSCVIFDELADVYIYDGFGTVYKIIII